MLIRIRDHTEGKVTALHAADSLVLSYCIGSPGITRNYSPTEPGVDPKHNKLTQISPPKKEELYD